MLEKALALGRRFYVHAQRPDGGFNYEYNFDTKKQSSDDNQVRQAGALWGLALVHQYAPGDDTRAALEKGFKFFASHARPGPGKSSYVHYPGQRAVSSGAVALVALALTEYLRSDATIPTAHREKLRARLDAHLDFLKSMQHACGNFSKEYYPAARVRSTISSPYYDGEVLLALCKAAKYMDRPDLVPVIERAAAFMAPHYTLKAWERHRDSDLTKGFYQWGSMAFWEYQDAGWKGAETFADTTLALGWWVIHTHRFAGKRANTSYALEGLCHAYRIAEAREHRAAMSEIRSVVDQVMYRLLKLQVGGPLAREAHLYAGRKTDDPLAVGGFLNVPTKPALRIDVTQHQLHAIMLALRHVYRGVSGEGSEVRTQRSEVRGQKSEVKSQRSEVRGQKSGVRGQKSEVRGQRSEVRGQKSEVRGQ